MHIWDLPGLHEAATRRQFGQFARTSPLNSIDEVFREVESGGSHYGVVPVENSTEGMVNHTLDCFMATSLNICGEVELPIHHALLARAGTEPEQIDCVYSHEQSLAQCRSWLDTHLPNVERRAVASNAEAAKLAGELERSAAIAGEVAGDSYGLSILHGILKTLRTTLHGSSSSVIRMSVQADMTKHPSLFPRVTNRVLYIRFWNHSTEVGLAFLVSKQGPPDPATGATFFL
ncbi:MAG: hypothetical protein CM1200mP9_00380 [Gammaproteobacteria bacterium]|nr:MAG: hypothetical protein CM1200mP9_00380 [Gammaproteobacteria bacterium]